ncbi:50S ribosomal protein L25/general stress protein Ctc [Variovorax soli]|uniref:Large ribosomal subunit protein bL25 n=1 Tax=Variovorax soli TaxID=376815 RepID=A0ABU1NIW4_9BURK|nr:50S ribosomal protein L25/general stress protein Ctc [Variovorax soli]MDR6538392.1 large subunit ribosomal protein L25 [Variovorax soli]
MKFVAYERAKQGTGASRRLRISGKTPGIVYGGEGQPQLIELDHNALWHALKKEAFHSSILEMEMGGATSKVLLRDVQYHPFRPLVQHVDFQRVDARTRMTVKVPLHFKGEEESTAVKLDHNLVNHVMTELEVSCLPADLPEFIEVDLSGLTKNATLHVSDIKLPKGLKYISHGRGNPVVVSAVAPLVAEEAAPAEGTAEAAPAAAKTDAKAAPAKKK